MQSAGCLAESAGTPHIFMETVAMAGNSSEFYFREAIEPFYYALFAVCLIIVAQVYSRIHAYIARESEIRTFKRIIRVYVIYVLEDLSRSVFPVSGAEPALLYSSRTMQN